MHERVKALETPTGILFHQHYGFGATVFGSVHLSILVPSVASDQRESAELQDTFFDCAASYCILDTRHSFVMLAQANDRSLSFSTVANLGQTLCDIQTFV